MAKLGTKYAGTIENNDCSFFTLLWRTQDLTTVRGTSL